MQCKELEAVLEREGLDVLPLEAQEHLAECTTCQDYLSDLSAVTTAAKHFPPEVNPPERVWVSLRAQLEAEGIIREPQAIEESAKASWWQSIAAMFRPTVLASVAAGVIVVAGALYTANRSHSNGDVRTASSAAGPVAETPKPASDPAPGPVEKTSVVPISPASQLARHKAPVHDLSAPLRPSPSENIYAGDTAAVLSQTENSLSGRALAPNAAVDAALRENLRTLNGFIAECQTRLKQNPQDQLSRQYLNMAYQQKAELLSAMMDSGRSDQ